MRVIINRKQMPFDVHCGLPMAILVGAALSSGVVTAARALRFDQRDAYAKLSPPTPPVYDHIPWVSRFRGIGLISEAMK